MANDVNSSNNNQSQPKAPMQQSPLKGKFQDLENTSGLLRPVQPNNTQQPVAQTNNQTVVQPQNFQTQTQPPKPKPQLPANLNLETKQPQTGQKTQITPKSKKRFSFGRDKFASAFRIIFAVLLAAITFFAGVLVQQYITQQEDELLVDTSVSENTKASNPPAFENNQTFEELIDFTDWYADPKPTTFLFRDENNQQTSVDGFEMLAFDFRSPDLTENLLDELESYLIGYDWIIASGNNVGQEATSGIKRGYIKGNNYIIIDYREYTLQDSIESKLIVNFN